MYSLTNMAYCNPEVFFNLVNTWSGIRLHRFATRVLCFVIIHGLFGHTSSYAHLSFWVLWEEGRVEKRVRGNRWRWHELIKFTSRHQGATSLYLMLWWGFHLAVWQWWHFQCKVIFSRICLSHLRHQKDVERNDMTWRWRCRFYLFMFASACVRRIVFVRIKYLDIYYAQYYILPLITNICAWPNSNTKWGICR